MHQRQKQRPNKRQTTTTVAAAQLTPRLVNRAAGPAVLTTLQTRLERELADLPAAGSDTGWDRARLQVFGTCWDEMCHEFTNYRPLLTSIKSEYERFISHYEAELTRIEPQLELVKDLQTQKERTVRDTRAECAAATAKLKKAIEAADTERVMAEAESEKTARLLVRSNSELETTKGDIEQMHELNLSLMSSIQRYEGELKAQITLEEEEHRNVDTYKAQLDLLLHDYQHLLDQHADANDELVVADKELHVKKQEVCQLTSSCKALESDLSAAKDKHKASRDKYRDIRRKYGSMQRLLSGASGRPLTPRPNWKGIVTDSGLPDINTEQPSALVVQEICDAVEHLRDDLEAARDKLPWVQAEKKEKAAMAGKWFVCRGTGPGIPKFLRFQGKVRNRNMQKGDCEKLISGFWAFKTKAEKKKKNTLGGMVPDQLFNFLKSKYGVASTIVEMGYNLVDALKRYQHDADCELFHKILFGELCEDAYYTQVRMLDGFTKALHDRDKKLNGKKSAKGVLNREDFIGVIDAFFPVKTDGDIKALRSALQYDQPLPVVNIDRIFEETANGDQGKFVETLRDQNLYDVMSCYPAIEDSIRRAVQYEKGGSAAVMAGGGGRLAKTSMM